MVATAGINLNAALAARAESVTVARQLVGELAERAGAPEGQVEAIRLAVSEAVTNAIVHGYRGADGEVAVTAGVAGEELWVLVTDEGCGHQTPPASPGLGWGLALIADACEEFVIAEGSGGGTEVRMRFKLGGGSPSEPQPGRTRDYV
jgi:anti-sigma regulatory factor (Ser/Thr protein kinase)